MKTNHVRYQQGMGLLSLLALLAILGFLSIMLLRIFPIYLNHFKITTHITEIATNPETHSMSRQEIKNLIGKRFQVDNVDYIDIKKDIEITSDKKKQRTITVNYEARVDLFYNLALIAKFDNLTREVVKP